MKKYRVNYYFDGFGYAIVEAKNKKEAEDKFYDGDTLEWNDDGNDYVIEDIEPVIEPIND